MSAEELSQATWKDFEKLFRRHGGVWGGCWCMYYHTTRGWSKLTPRQNKADKQKLVLNGKAHGVLVYDDGDPIGWCQYGPRYELPKIDHMKSYISKDGDLWRITCFFIDRRYRGRGVSRFLLDSAVRFMKKRGVRTVEAYPIDPSRGHYSASLLWWGTLGLFRGAGFKIAGSLGKTPWGKHHPIVRKTL